MVKSAACNLATLSPKELIEKLEEPEEMGGYYIINGNEKVTRMLIQQKANFPIVFKRPTWKNRGNNFTEMGCQIRCLLPDQSSITCVLHYLSNGQCIYCFNYMKELFFIPLPMLLKMLSNNTDNFIYQELMRGRQNDSFYKGCITNMLRQLNDENLLNREDILSFIGERFRVKTRLGDHFSFKRVGDYIVRHCILPHLTKYEQKFDLLVYMTQKLFAFSSGECCSEEADNPMFQEALTSGALYQIIIKDRLEIWLQGVKSKLLYEFERKPAISMDIPGAINICHKKVADLTKGMDYVLATGNVISKSGLGLMQSTGMCIMADKLNMMRFVSHFRCIHRGAFFTTMRTTSVRRLLPEAWGFMCPVHTPDGTPCGLMNHLTADCSVVCQRSNTLCTGLPVLLMEMGMKDFCIPALKDDYTVLLDGKLVGRVSDQIVDTFIQVLRQYKINGLKVPSTMEIVHVKRTKYKSQYPGIYLSTTMNRFLRPVHNISCNSTEMIGIFEQAYLNIAITMKEAYPELTTHKEITEQSLLSVAASMTPFSDFNQSPRNMYQCQMGKQTMGIACQALHGRSDNKLYNLNTPQSAIVRPGVYDKYKMDDYPLGTNAVVAVISYTGYDMEDAMILNKSAYERGFAYGCIYKTEVWDLAKKNEFGVKLLHKFGATNENKGSLNLDGLPPVGLYLEKGNNMYSYYNIQTGVYKYKVYDNLEPAFVHAVKLLGNADGSQELQKVAVVFRIERNPIIGDKFSSRHGQKGICSQRWRVEDMPFTESGMQPDIIFNPHGFPSRMTIGMMIESMAGKSAAMHGLCHDATPFTFSEDQSAVEYFGDLLTKAGYNYYGSERMYSGVDGRELKADIFMGIVYYQRLRHMVSDKFQVRATGTYDTLTHQPVKGRKKGGGVRFGEMERDAMIAHGTSFLLQDRLLNCSDLSEAKICSQCGSMIAPYMRQTCQIGIEKQADISVNHEGHWMCSVCFNVNTIQTVNVPYVFKYLIAELSAINVKVFIELK